MLEREIMGIVIWECDTEEANLLFKHKPADRWRIWTHDEVTAHMSDTPEQLAECIQRKRDKPGKLSV